MTNRITDIAIIVLAIVVSLMGFFISHDYFVPAIMLWIAAAVARKDTRKDNV